MMPAGAFTRKREERLARLADMRMHTGNEAVPYGYVTAREAARRFGVSMKTIERDKAELRRRAERRVVLAEAVGDGSYGGKAGGS